MEERHFDALARTLGRGIARRTATGALLGGALTALLSPTPEAGAACRRAGARCERSGDCCRGSRCRGRRCACNEGLTACDGRCRDVQTDSTNCGTCGRVCKGDRSTCCDGRCVNTDTDLIHCGACENPCSGSQICQRFERCCTPTGGSCLGGDLEDCCHPNSCRLRLGSILGTCCLPSRATCRVDDDCCSGTCTIIRFEDIVIAECE